MATWASTAGALTGLTEVRDVREVQTIAAALDHINARDLSSAMDILCQRILSIQSAKKKGGSWEKAEQVELLPGSGHSLASGGMLALGV